MQIDMSFNSELGFFAWLDTVAYMLDCELSELRTEERAWRAFFDAGARPAEAIRTRNAASN